MRRTLTPVDSYCKGLGRMQRDDFVSVVLRSRYLLSLD